MAEVVSAPAQRNDPGACPQFVRCEFSPVSYLSLVVCGRVFQQPADGRWFAHSPPIAMLVTVV